MTLDPLRMMGEGGFLSYLAKLMHFSRVFLYIYSDYPVMELSLTTISSDLTISPSAGISSPP